MADHYAELTETERAYWDIYTRLRAISDWEGFSDGQDQVRREARDWLVAQRKFIWRCAEGTETPTYEAGWDIHDRAARWEQLTDDNLNVGTCRRVCQLPTGAGTPTEKAGISEREMWWRVSSVDARTKGWRQANADWATARRKQVWHLGEDDGWNEADREVRYANLCIATKHGSAYEQWLAGHDPDTGESVGANSARADAVANCRRYLGVNENPPNSNRGPEIDGWCRRVYGGVGVPWCACFATCMAWDAGAHGASSAGVQVIVDMARAHEGMFRGWTTDPGQVLRGDLAVISCTTCHIGMVVDSDDPWHTIEGNTSPGVEGSQYDGGCVAERDRRGEVIGWALVDYP